MALLPIVKFGGTLPIITDPLLLPEGKSQVAVDCRFDHGGVEALLQDLFNSTPTNAGPLLSLFLYQFAGKFLAWADNVSACQAPLANDSFNRIYYTEGGALKVTDSTLYDQGGTNYPMASLNPSPPAPGAALVATAHGIPPTTFIGLYRINLQGTTVQITYPSGPGWFPEISNINPETPLTFYGTGIPALDNQTFNFSDVTYDGNENFNLTTNASNGTIITSLMSGAIQAITRANPGVVTSAGHNLITGDKIIFTVMGMVQLNTVTATITVINANSFSLGIDTTAFTAFVSGSWSLQQRLSSVFTPSYITISTGSGDSISNAKPAKVGHTAHGLTTGTTINFGDMQGMTQLNGVVARITVIDANNFTLDNIDSTAYGAFVSGIYGKYPSFSLVEDPTQQISVYYVETYVNQYGSEGPPCPVDTVYGIASIYDGDTVDLASTNTVAPAGMGSSPRTSTGRTRMPPATSNFSSCRVC